MSDRGSILPASAAIAALLAAATVATAALGTLYAAREQAFIAADAAALAAAVASFPAAASSTPLAAARFAAAANGAALIECVCPVDESPSARVTMVTTGLAVEVPVFGEVTVRARSRAEFDPIRWLGG